jgi:hypothetical protein
VPATVLGGGNSTTIHDDEQAAMRVRRAVVGARAPPGVRRGSGWPQGEGTGLRFQDILLAMRRRWYLAVATVVLAVAATLLTVGFVGPTYQAEGAVLLVPPGSTLDQRPGAAASSGNPYLELAPLNQARDIVIRSVSAKSTYISICQTTGDARYESMRRSLCSPHPKISFEVTEDYESTAPVILVTAEAGSAQDAVTTLTTVMDRVPATLSELQGGLNLSARVAITSTPIVTDTLPDVLHKDQIRAAVLVGGGVLALGALVTGLIDGLFLPWRRPAANGLDPDDTDEALEVDTPDAATDTAAGGSPAAEPPPAPVVRRPPRPTKPARRPPPVPDWGTPTDQELAGVGVDRSTPHWD